MIQETLLPRAEVESPLSPIPVLIAGLPDGKMARPAAAGLSLDPGFKLLDVALCSARNHCGHTNVADKRILTLMPRDPENSSFPQGTIAVDFTTPRAAQPNAEFYAAAGLPFVMGTTGADFDAIGQIVRNSKKGISAVIAPNMSLEVVRRQMEIEDMALQRPDIFRGTKVYIRESHPSTKRDISGTARDFAARFENHGAETFIESIRDPKTQRSLGIPNPDAHGYHWVWVQNPNGKFILKFETKIDGRSDYIPGLLMAVDFLSGKTRAGSRNEVFSMIDVVREQERMAA